MGKIVDLHFATRPVQRAAQQFQAGNNSGVVDNDARVASSRRSGFDVLMIGDVKEQRLHSGFMEVPRPPNARVHPGGAAGQQGARERQADSPARAGHRVTDPSISIVQRPPADSPAYAFISCQSQWLSEPFLHHFWRISLLARSHESPDLIKVSRYVPVATILVSSTSRKSDTALAESPSTVIQVLTVNSVP